MRQKLVKNTTGRQTIWGGKLFEPGEVKPVDADLPLAAGFVEVSPAVLEEAAKPGPKTPRSMTECRNVQEVFAHIKTLDSIEEIAAFVDGDARTTVIKAADTRIAQIEEAEAAKAKADTTEEPEAQG